jgi:hypothetical protein
VSVLMPAAKVHCKKSAQTVDHSAEQRSRSLERRDRLQGDDNDGTCNS